MFWKIFLRKTSTKFILKNVYRSNGALGSRYFPRNIFVVRRRYQFNGEQAKSRNSNCSWGKTLFNVDRNSFFSKCTELVHKFRLIFYKGHHSSQNHSFYCALTTPIKVEFCFMFSDLQIRYSAYCSSDSTLANMKNSYVISYRGSFTNSVNQDRH